MDYGCVCVGSIPGHCSFWNMVELAPSGVLRGVPVCHVLTVKKMYAYPGLPGSLRPACISAIRHSFSSRSNWRAISSCRNDLARGGRKSMAKIALQSFKVTHRSLR
jgi:hypothetical protein